MGREINSREDYIAVVQKYAARLKVARSKYDDFKREVVELERALKAPAPKEASEAERGEYERLIKDASLHMKNLDRFIAEYDDKFDDWSKTVKILR